MKKVIIGVSAVFLFSVVVLGISSITAAWPWPNLFNETSPIHTPNEVYKGEDITFIATDVDDGNPYSYVMIICDSEGVVCGGNPISVSCLGKELCHSSEASSGTPVSCSHTIGDKEKRFRDYYAYTCNSNGNIAEAPDNPYSYNVKMGKGNSKRHLK
jgi:hypothetical protein